MFLSSLHIKNLLLPLLLLMVFSAPLLASHIAAVTISYQSVDTFKKIITVNIFRECKNPNGVTGSITINYSSASCGLSGSAALYLVTGTGSPGTGNFISLPCLGIDTCYVNQPGYAVEEFTYEDTIILPGRCSDWIISHETPGLRNTNDVLVNPTTQPTYVSAIINNLKAPLNNSPVFEKPPVAIFCVDFEYYFQQDAIDADGDSLKYVLSPAQGTGGMLIPYVPGFSDTNPIGSTFFTLDPENGILNFIPNQFLTSVFCINIEEYMDDTLIGSIKTDMQVLIKNTGNCKNDTLKFKGDGTPPTGNYPAKTDTCLFSAIRINFEGQVKCESIAQDGSDFLLVNTFGDSIAIDTVLFACDVNGLTDTITLALKNSGSVILNGSYFLYSRKGNDGNPVMSACDRPLSDTLEIQIHDCPLAYVDLKNVSVLNNDSIEVRWKTFTQDFPDSFFIRYDICRSSLPVNACSFSVSSLYNLNDTVFYDKTVDVSSQNYYYNVKLFQQISLLDTLSDSVRSILLNIDNTVSDTAQVFISWTQYWGWNNPLYYVMERTGKDGSWVEIASTPGLSYIRLKPWLANEYWLKVETRDPLTQYLIAESNWVRYVVHVWPVPNVITPNFDGINDYFFVNELLLHPRTHLKIYNRWGNKVYEDDDYNNTWRGTRFNGSPLSDGTYYYVLQFSDGASKSGFVTILR